MAKLTIKKQEEIEHTFMIRMQEFGYKPNSKAYNNAQSHYFVGAMIGTGQKHNTIELWSICIVSGRSIFETRQSNKKSNGK